MLNQTAIARPYAKALFMHANEHQTVSKWASWLNFAKEVVSSAEIQALLRNPHVDVMLQSKLLIEVMNTVYPNHPSAEVFLTLLAENHRIAVLPAIASAFSRLQSQQEKTVKVMVRTASLLTPAQEKKLQERLAVRLGQAVSIEQQQDASIIGGFVIDADDWVIDGSVKGQLKKLAATLAA